MNQTEQRIYHELVQMRTRLDRLISDLVAATAPEPNKKKPLMCWNHRTEKMEPVKKRRLR